jgi:bifunctional DNase/RNase
MASLADVGFTPMRLTKVVAVGSKDRHSFCAVLEGVSDDSVLPILIGQMEGFYLSAALTGVEFGRPMSPQFAAGLLRALGGRLRQVRIDRLINIGDGTAYGSTVELEGPSGVTLLDARPSDALGLAAHVPAPILAAQDVLAHARHTLAGDSPDADLLRRAIQAEQAIVRQ